MNLKQAFLRKFDWFLFSSAFVLGIIGLVAIYSSDLGTAGAEFANFKKQLIAFSIGLLAFFIISILNFRQFRNAKNILYIVGFLFLVGVLIFGKTLRGTTGWFVFGPFGFQPVEIVKIILVIFLADYFAREGRKFFSFLDILKSLVAVVIFMALVLFQPDLGSSMILFTVWMAMLLASRVRKRHLIILFLIFIATSLIFWIFILVPYQKDRIKVFLNPSLDPLGSGYNIKQAIITVGSGGLYGKGLGLGSQTQLRFLPETHTDFIFALIAEEMGFFIVVLVLGLYSLLLLRTLALARESGDDFSAYLAIGFLAVFGTEIFINIGMNLGLMPVTGLALPFMSLGGSSLISKFIMLGVLESVRMRS